MNIVVIKHFMVSEISKVSVFGHCPYSVTFLYVHVSLHTDINDINITNNINIIY